MALAMRRCVPRGRGGVVHRVPHCSKLAVHNLCAGAIVCRLPYDCLTNAYAVRFCPAYAYAANTVGFRGDPIGRGPTSDQPGP